MASNHRADRLPAIRSQLRRNVLDAFNEAGVEDVSPRYSAIRDGNHSTIVKGGADGDAPSGGTDTP